MLWERSVCAFLSDWELGALCCKLGRDLVGSLRYMTVARDGVVWGGVVRGLAGCKSTIILQYYFSLSGAYTCCLLGFPIVGV